MIKAIIQKFKSETPNTQMEWLTLGLIVLAAWTRLIPHAPNFTAIGAMAVFAGAKIKSKKLALILPLASLFLSDLVLGLHSTLLWVYLGFILVTITTNSLQTNWLSVTSRSIQSSLIFFLVSNLGVFVSTNLYPQTMTGFIQCFTMAIPFAFNQFLADMIFISLALVIFEASKKRILSPTSL